MPLLRLPSQLDVIQQPDFTVLGRHEHHRLIPRPETLHRPQRLLVHHLDVIHRAPGGFDGGDDDVSGVSGGQGSDGRGGDFSEGGADGARGDAIFRRESDVSTAHGESVGFAREGHADDVDVEVEVPDHAPDDAPLLVIFLTEHGDVGLDESTIKEVLREYDYINADVTVREELTIDLDRLTATEIEAKTDYMDYAIIADAEGSLEDGILTLTVDLRPEDER